MRITKLGAMLGAGALMLAGCSGSGASEDATPDTETETAQQSDEADDYVTVEEQEPCFTVGDVGSRLSLDWELVVASRDQPDQPEYLEDLMDRGDDFAEDAEPESYPLCKGYQEIADFNYEVAKLNLDVLVDEDTDEQYQKIAEIGNELLEVSDDEGYEWSYEFVSDVSEIDP